MTTTDLRTAHRGRFRDSDRVIGVETADGKTILADRVVSDFGSRDTVDTRLPDGHGAATIEPTLFRQFRG